MILSPQTSLSKRKPPAIGRGLQRYVVKLLRAATIVHRNRIRLPIGDTRRERLERAGQHIHRLIAEAEGCV